MMTTIMSAMIVMVPSGDDDDDDGVGHGINSTSIKMTQSSRNGKRLCVYY